MLPLFNKHKPHQTSLRLSNRVLRRKDSPEIAHNIWANPHAKPGCCALEVRAMIMKIHDEANRFGRSEKFWVSREGREFISCCHDQNHNSSVVAIKMLEKHIKSHFEAIWVGEQAEQSWARGAIYNAFMFRLCTEELKHIKCTWKLF